jgi:hypothetical protein
MQTLNLFIMRKLFAFLTLSIFVFACQQADEVTPSKGEVKAVWSSTDRWGSWSNGGYTLYNDVWGSGYGPQTIWANSYSNWGVWSNQPNTGGIKSYPNCVKVVNKTFSSLASCKSSFNCSTPSGGAWESTYDIWAGANKQYETMLWMNYTGNADGSGNVKPISYNWSSTGTAIPAYKNVSVGGHTWNVFRGNNGGGATTFSFLRTSKSNSGTVDILAIQKWIQARGWMGNETLRDVDYGFEITSSSGGMNFVCNSYSVSFN